MSKNVLIIGSYSVEGIDSFSWFQELPNISDYDTIILDTARIFVSWSLAGKLKHFKGNIYFLQNPSELDKKIKSNIHMVREKLIEILEFDVNIYVLYLPDIDISTGITHIDMSGDALIPFVNTNAWCPISIDIVSEKGKTIYVKDDSYKGYFSDFKGWEYYFVPDSLKTDELESYYRQKWKVIPHLDIIATNKTDKPIAIEFLPRFHFWPSKEQLRRFPFDQYGWGFYLNKKMGGSLVLLPVADKYNTGPLIEILLQRGKEFEETPPPSWVNNIEVPGEVSLKREIAVEKQNLEAVEAKIEELEASLMGVEKYKRLLYADGLELQDICKLTLEKLGAKLKPSPVSDEFMIEVDGKEALVEVKGSTKNIDKDDIGQLITDLGQLVMTMEEPKIVKGILIGNAWRLLPLEDRDTKDKPLFTGHVVQYAETQNIGLISTTDLFKAYCKTVEEPQHKTEILSKIISGKGVIKF